MEVEGELGEEARLQPGVVGLEVHVEVHVELEVVQVQAEVHEHLASQR